MWNMVWELAAGRSDPTFRLTHNVSVQRSDVNQKRLYLLNFEWACGLAVLGTVFRNVVVLLKSRQRNLLKRTLKATLHGISDGQSRSMRHSKGTDNLRLLTSHQSILIYTNTGIRKSSLKLLRLTRVSLKIRQSTSIYDNLAFRWGPKSHGPLSLWLPCNITSFAPACISYGDGLKKWLPLVTSTCVPLIHSNSVKL